MSAPKPGEQKPLKRDMISRTQFQLPFSPHDTTSTLKVSKLLHCSSETVRHMIEEGELEAYQLRPGIPGSPWRVYKESVARHLRKIRNTYHLHDL